MGEPFNRDAFAVEVMHFGDWIEAAEQAGNVPERRRRTWAALRWLEKQKKLAPADMHAGIDVAVAGMNACLAKIPKSKENLAVASTPNREPRQSYEEVAQRLGAELLESIKSVLNVFPPGLAQDIEFCLTASQGLKAPEIGFCDHAFGRVLSNYARAIDAKNPSAVADAVDILKKWAVKTTIHTGVDRLELIRRVEKLTDVSSQKARLNRRP